MPYAGKQLQPREIAALCYEHGWRGGNLIKIVATCLAESQGYTRAYNDNIINDVVRSRDVGLFQINIPTTAIGTVLEKELYDQNENVKRARELWERRKFQPWYAYTQGWATFPEWWVWTSKTPRQWAATGRYIHRSIRGVANFEAERAGIEPVPFLDYRSIPPKPSSPPADGVGPRPVPNDGKE